MFNILPQKCLHLHLEEKKKKPNLNHIYMGTEKLNGWYAYIDYSTELGWGNFRSRVGREIPSLKWAREMFIDMFPKPKSNIRLIMEVVIDGIDFHELNGILNRSKGDCQALEAKFHLHDLIDIDTYFINSKENYAISRYEKLANIFENFAYLQIADRINLIKPLFVSDSRDVWLETAEKLINANKEGIVLKQTDSLYQPDKKNSSLLKIKCEEEFDLHCIDIYYTVGEKGHPNLNITLRDKSGIEVSVRVPKHSDIALIEEDRNYILDKVVMIRCMNKTELNGYYQPRFVCVRHDKFLKDID